VTEDLKQAEKNVLKAVDDVAERLGNTRDIARASYISPRVIDHYMEGSVVEHHVERLEAIIAAKQEDLTEAEKALLNLLKRKLRRELCRSELLHFTGALLSYRDGGHCCFQVLLRRARLRSLPSSPWLPPSDRSSASCASKPP